MTAPHQPDYASAQPGKSSNGLAVGALVCGIIALVLSPVPCVNVVAPLIALVALVLGIIGWVTAAKDPNQKPTMAIIGVALAVLAFIVFFVSYAVLGMFAEGVGGRVGQWGITTGATVQADALAEQARAQGVDEATITAAREELDAVLETVTTDVEDIERAQTDVNQALQQYQSTLEAAAGTSLEGADMSEENTDTDPSMFDDEYPVPEQGQQE